MLAETMIYTAIDTFYLTDEQLSNSPSRKDGIDQHTETNLRIYGCDLIQEGGILLRLPQQVTATAQVLFHRFYCKKSFVRFDVKFVAVSCIWLSCKLEQPSRIAEEIIFAFRKIECRREGLELERLDVKSTKYSELKQALDWTEKHLLKEMGFICHVQHPHKFILSYLATLETPPVLRQEAWNLANDTLRTTLCLRFKCEVVACGVVYAAARRFKVPLPENPPWWETFDAEKHQIDEICRVLAHLYTLPKAHFKLVCKEGPSFTINKSRDSQSFQVPNGCAPADIDTIVLKSAPPGFNLESDGFEDVLIKAVVDKKKNSTKGDPKSMSVDKEIRKETVPKSRFEHKTESSGDRTKEIGRKRDRKGFKASGRYRGRNYDRERDRELSERDKDVFEDRHNHTKERENHSGVVYTEKSRCHSSRYRDNHGSSHSSREKDSHRYHSHT